MISYPTLRRCCILVRQVATPGQREVSGQPAVVPSTSCSCQKTMPTHEMLRACRYVSFLGQHIWPRINDVSAKSFGEGSAPPRMEYVRAQTQQSFLREH